MRILQINSVCGIGSTGRITTGLYQALVQQGHDCCIAYGRGKAPEDIHTIRIGTNRDVYLHALYTRLTDKTGFASRGATKKLIKKIIQYKPDIIHLHNMHGYYINIELLFEYLNTAKIPVIWSLYDCWAFTGHCCHFDYVGCDKWKTGCRKCVQKGEYPTSFVIDNSKWNYHEKKSLILDCEKLMIVTPSMWLDNLVKKSYLNKFPTKIIPSGVDLTSFAPLPNNIRKKYKIIAKYIVLGLSNGFGKFKGMEYFIRLSKYLSQDYQIILVGVTEEQKKHFPSNIMCIPKTNHLKELAEFYTAADVFVNPTLQESQGLTNIEALACGTGVVTFRSGGSPECVDESCGIVVERENLKELYDAVVKSCFQPFDMEACIRRARKFDQSGSYRNYIELYESNVN